MGRCCFCCINETSSYWDYYCGNCTRVKSFCKLVGSDKLVKALQFNINKDKMRIVLNENVTKALNDLGADILPPPPEPRKSDRLKVKYDTNESLNFKRDID